MSKLINFKNPRQIINMGGPWIGELFYEQKFITDNIIIDNFIYNVELEEAYFIKYNRISHWNTNNYFSLLNVDFKKFCIKEYSTKFEMIFIVKIDNNILTYNKCFHNVNVTDNYTLNLNDYSYLQLP